MTLSRRDGETYLLSQYLLPECIRIGLAGRVKQDALDALVDTVLATGALKLDRGALLRAVVHREEIVSTGIGKGIAIPHAHLPGVERPLVALGVFPGGLDFQAMDEEPVLLVFLLLGNPEDPGLHMRILARIARLGKDTDFVEGLCAAGSAQEAVAVIRAAESRLSAPSTAGQGSRPRA
jgi:mannitol/fructose-specific phosphotransferase system IIA component (Ntr-type)